MECSRGWTMSSEPGDCAAVMLTLRIQPQPVLSSDETSAQRLDPRGKTPSTSIWIGISKPGPSQSADVSVSGEICDTSSVKSQSISA